MTPTNNLAVVHPEIAAEWHSEKNGSLTPDQVARAGRNMVWWQCQENKDHVWKASVKNRTVRRSQCPICLQEKRLQWRERQVYDAATRSGDYLRRYERSIKLLKQVVAHDFSSRPQVRRPVYGMIYVSAVTAMETYLCDTFLHVVRKHEKVMNRLLTTSPDFSEKKYALVDMINWSTKIEERITEYIFDIAWHNIAKARALYHTVLKIEFKGDLEYLYRAVSHRHDFVHRNGRTKEGKFHSLDAKKLNRLFDVLTVFVEGIDEELKMREYIDSDS